MRIMKAGNIPKVQPSREARRRSRISLRLTCPNCACEFCITRDEQCMAWDPMDPSTNGRETYGQCPHCYEPMSYYDSAVRVNEKGEPLPSRRAAK